MPSNNESGALLQSATTVAAVAIAIFEFVPTIEDAVLFEIPGVLTLTLRLFPFALGSLALVACAAAIKQMAAEQNLGWKELIKVDSRVAAAGLLFWAILFLGTTYIILWIT
ncbi:MAG: hypothetical protein FVQ83_13720 [Chloroflexi bacterium]|nr:hypothetical protein [Chloroflexota bacterium]